METTSLLHLNMNVNSCVAAAVLENVLPNDNLDGLVVVISEAQLVSG
jgi:formaldehyde-activating enzyme involved in methanogenesis